jgi:hypothetical protein
MATRFVVQPLPSVVVAGRRHVGFDVHAEGQIASGSDYVLTFVIEQVPVYFTLTLIEAFMVKGSAVDLRLGTEPPGGDPWDTIATLTAAAGLRHASDVRVTAPCRRLYGRATVSALPANEALRLRLTLVDLHK